MTHRGLASVIEFVRSLATDRVEDLTDTQLLHLFASRHDEDAFSLLVQRHGGMVWGLCERMLPHPDAEDAFQAVFLVLARRAGSIARPHLLANWLYGVAYRTALEARGKETRRRQCERPLVDVPVEPDPGWADLRPVLDAEVSGLPEKYRIPFVLCYLEGRTNEEAARMVGCPAGTIASRLAWARERLRLRLSRRGISLSAALLASLLGQHLSAGVPPATKAAVSMVTGGAVSAGAMRLMEGAMKTMYLSRLRMTGLVAGVMVVIAVAAALPHWSTAEPQQPERAVAPPEPAKPGLKVAEGDHHLVFPVMTDLEHFLVERDSKATKAFIVVDAVPLVREDGTIDIDGIQFEQLKNALKQYRTMPRKSRGNVLIQVVFSGAEPRSSADLLRYALHGFVREEGGFDHVWTMANHRGGPGNDWKQRVEAARESIADGSVEESPVSNKLVKTYPVRTMLSRWMTEGCDCVVHVQQPVDGDTVMRPALVEAIRTSIEALQLSQRTALFITLQFRRSGEQAVEKFVNTEKDRFAESLGFRRIVVQSAYLP